MKSDESRPDKQHPVGPTLTQRLRALYLCTENVADAETLKEAIEALSTPSAGVSITDEQRVLDAICKASGYESWFIARDLLMFQRQHPTEPGMLQAIPVHKIDFAPPSAIERTFVPTHSHADGGHYRFVANAKYKTAAEDAVWSDAFIYEAKDGRYYVTTPARWSDRFAPLHAATDRKATDG